MLPGLRLHIKNQLLHIRVKKNKIRNPVDVLDLVPDLDHGLPAGFQVLVAQLPLEQIQIDPVGNVTGYHRTNRNNHR
ncbi:hypothetical protein D3C80_2104710 [compost metagenome]